MAKSSSGQFLGGNWKLESSDLYAGAQYGRAILRKWKNNPESFKKGTVFSKGGARIHDLSILGSR